MEGIQSAALVGHFVGLALLLGATATSLRAAGTWPTRLMLLGAATQLLTGLALTASREIQHLPVEPTKIATKLGVSLLVLAVVLCYRRATCRPQVLLYLTGLLTVTNVIVAVTW